MLSGLMSDACNSSYTCGVKPNLRSTATDAVGEENCSVNSV